MNEGNKACEAKKRRRNWKRPRCLVPPMQPISMFWRLPGSQSSRHVVEKWKPGAGASVVALQCRRPPHNPGVALSYQVASFPCCVSASRSAPHTPPATLFGVLDLAVVGFLSKLLLDVSRFRRVAANMDRETSKEVTIDVMLAILACWVMGNCSMFHEGLARSVSNF